MKRTLLWCIMIATAAAIAIASEENLKSRIVESALAEYKGGVPTSISIEWTGTAWVVECNDGPATMAYGFTRNGDRDKSHDWSSSY